MTGQFIVRRQFCRGHDLGRVWVARLAAEDEYGLWLWVAGGSLYLDVAAADGRTFREVPFRDWPSTAKAMRHRYWSTDVLMLHPRDGAYSLWYFFDPQGGLLSWYVNLEEPVRRWDDGHLSGVDTVDQDLDLVVAPDRSWRWKDEDEFADHLAVPEAYWVRDAAAVRAEGERLVKLIDAAEFPFDGTGTGFRPDPSWSAITELPAGWDRSRAW